MQLFPFLFNLPQQIRITLLSLLPLKLLVIGDLLLKQLRNGAPPLPNFRLYRSLTCVAVMMMVMFLMPKLLLRFLLRLLLKVLLQMLQILLGCGRFFFKRFFRVLRFVLHFVLRSLEDSEHLLHSLRNGTTSTRRVVVTV